MGKFVDRWDSVGCGWEFEAGLRVWWWEGVAHTLVYFWGPRVDAVGLVEVWTLMGFAGGNCQAHA